MNLLLPNISLFFASQQAFFDGEIEWIISCFQIAKRCAADKGVCFRRLSQTETRNGVAEKSQSKSLETTHLLKFLTPHQADFLSSRGCTTVEDTLLEGRLKIAKELLQFQPEDVKRRLGSAENGGENLVQDLVEEFLCPASKQLSLYTKGVGELARSFMKDCSSFCENLFAASLPSESKEAICSSHSTQLAAYDLLVVLCCNCIPNMERLCQLQDELFYSG